MILAEIMLINIILSGDNAVVIAMASKNLSDKQRNLAIWWGAFGAVVLRIGLIFIVVILLKVPWLQAIGGIMLSTIAIQLLKDGDQHGSIREALSLAGAIWTILIADFVMSLDNVLAIAAVAKGELWMIVIGVGASIPIIIWGSTFIVKLLQRYAFVMLIGAAVLGYTAGEMFIRDQGVQHVTSGWPTAFHYIVPFIFVVIVLLAGRTSRR